MAASTLLKQNSVAAGEGITITHTPTGGVIIASNTSRIAIVEFTVVEGDTTKVFDLTTLNTTSSADITVWHKESAEKEVKVNPDVWFTPTQFVADMTDFPAGEYCLKISIGILETQIVNERLTVDALEHSDGVDSYYRLDADYPQIPCYGRYDAPKRIRLRVKSADNTISGNIVLRVTANESVVLTETVVPVPAGGEEAWVDIPLSTGLNCRLLIERLHADARDTLKSGDSTVISALVVDAAWQRGA